MAIDLDATVLADFDRYLDTAEDPRHQTMIRNYREHVRCEETGDLDTLGTLLTADAEYHVHGPGAPIHLKGRDAILAQYRSYPRHESIELELEHLAVTDWGLSGILRSVTLAPGTLLALSGAAVSDSAASYRMELRLAFFRPFDGDLACGISYFGSHPAVSPL